MRRKTILSLIKPPWAGVHTSGWRHPDEPSNLGMDFERIKQLAQTAERGKFHLFFLADGVGPQFIGAPETVALTSESVFFEPFTLCSALAQVTDKIGLALTASTTYSEPYNLARMFASLDHLSGGRACWNVVTSAGEAAPNFNNRLPDHETRYARAAEFLDVSQALWDSWEDDAFIYDKAGRYFDPEKMHVPNFRGDFFQVQGPLNISRPPQGHPVIAQAGASPTGLNFATRVGELIFCFDQGLEKGKELYARVKEGAAEHGRDRDHIKVLSALNAVLGRTQSEAEEKFETLNELTDPQVGIERLKVWIDFDLSPYPLDGPVPLSAISVTEGSQSQQEHYLKRARDEKYTVRQLALFAAQFGVVPMSVDAVVEHIDERISNRAADGFNFAPGDPVGSMELFVDHVVPELQRRGLFHADYQGKTLRENLGLPRPQNRFQR